jgi:nitroreductase
MELYDVMRTTFAMREFTDDPLPDPVLYRILDNARFAPSGGNRQATHITVVRDATVRQRLAALNVQVRNATSLSWLRAKDLGTPSHRAVCPAKPSRPQPFPMNSPRPFGERRSYW